MSRPKEINPPSDVLFDTGWALCVQSSRPTSQAILGSSSAVFLDRLGVQSPRELRKVPDELCSNGVPFTGVSRSTLYAYLTANKFENLNRR